MRVLKFISLALFFVGIGYGAYYFYNEFFGKKGVDGVHLISSDAIFVLETDRGDEFWERFTEQPFWYNLQEIPSVSDADSHLRALSELLEGYQSLSSLLRGKKLTVSLHPIGKNDFDFLFTLQLKNSGEKDFLNFLQNNLPELSQINERMYAGVSIKEFQSLNLDRNFSFTWVGDVLVGSFTSFLVEESIRHSQNNSLSNFKAVYKPLFDSELEGSGLATLRVSSHGFARLIEGISKVQSQPFELLFSKNMLMANYWINFEEEGVVMNGKCFFPLSSVTPIRGEGNNELNRFISNRVASWSSFNLNKGESSNFFINQGFIEKNTVKGDIEKKLKENDFLSKLTGQFLLMNFESSGLNTNDKVLVLKTQDLDRQLKLLKEFNPGEERYDLSLSQVDFFGDHEIFVLTVEEFPAHLFAGKFLGFPDTYVTGIDGHLVFANSSKAMKLYLDDLSSNNLRKNITENSIASIMDFHLDFTQSWNSFIDNSAASWAPFFQKYSRPLLSFQNFNLSLGSFDGKSFTSTIKLSQSSIVTKPQGGERQEVFLAETKSFVFPAELSFGPQRILNFNDKSPEFVVQDEDHVLYLITEDMVQVFAKKLEGPIVSVVFQVDYLKNGKLQMLFATASQVHIIDRLGNYISGFPVSPTSEKISQLDLVDYNNDRDYRYFVGTSDGGLWLLDRAGRALDGWNPKRISAEPVVKPSHRRIAGVGDRMIAMASNGELYFFNRRGEAEVGSPFKLGDGLSSDYVIIERGNAKDTRLVTVTSGGEVVQVNFNGEMTYRNQLVKDDKETKFRLIKDQKEDRYLITSHGYNKLSVYDENYQLLFQKDIVSDNLKLQFYSFGGDKNLLSVLDLEQEFLYLYNLKGDLLNAMPISAAQRMELIYSGSQNEYLIYTVSGNKLAEYRLPF